MKKLDNILKINKNDFPIKGKRLEKWVEGCKKRGIMAETEENGETVYLIDTGKIPETIYRPTNPNKIIDVEIVNPRIGTPYANLIFSDGTKEKFSLK